MNPKMAAFFGTMAVYVVVALYIGWVATRKSKAELQDYAVASRSLGLIAQGFTFSATYFSSFAFLGVAAMNYAHGLAYWTVSPLTTGFTALVAWIIGRKVWVLGKRYGYISLADLLGDFYQSDVIRLLVALIGAVFIIPYIGTQMTGAGYVFNVVTNGLFPVEGGAFAFLVLTIIYVVAGGLRAVAWTDVFQGAFMYVAMLTAVALILWTGFGGIFALSAVAAEKIPQYLTLPGGSNFITPLVFVGLWLPVNVGLLMSPHMFLRLYTAKSLATLKWSMFVSGVFLATYHFMTPYVGLAARLLNPKWPVPDMIMPELLFKYVPTVLASIIICGALAAMMSTVDSQMHALSMVVTHDIVRKYVVPRAPGLKISEEGYFRLGRWLIVVGGLLSFWAAITIKGFMVIITTLAGGGFLQMTPALLGALYWKRSSRLGAIAGLIVGTVLCSLWTLRMVPCYGGATMAGVWAVAINAVIFVVVSLVSSPQPPEVVTRFYDI
ncbi:MAG: sodium:solute symporter family protein [Firmicutes bacterium]|nr:sodium:solute symporter family protein [Bacillota bacterium]